MGVSIPAPSVVGTTTSPGCLTSPRHRRHASERLGEEGMRILLRQIEGEDPGAVGHVKIEPRLGCEFT
jgi:hypothetical protein